MPTTPRRAKIVCTLGPSSTPEVLRTMIESGMDVARLNFSHGTHDDHRAMFDLVNTLSREVGRPVAILQDLQGPKIRVGKFTGNKATLKKGQTFTITSEKVKGNSERVSTTYGALGEDVLPGDVLLLDDGLLRLKVKEVIDCAEVICEVEIGGVLGNNKGINLPGAAVSAPSMTAKDKADLALGMELGVDYVALSFVRTALDVHMLRALMTSGKGRRPHIISKIEKPEAVEALTDIINISEGIMIARGDLGVELPPEKVPMFQKRAIREATAARRLTITATQMLDSMTKNPRPTRAEASDVANAIMDGTGAVMLSGETAAGDYPVEAVQMMARIVTEVERSDQYHRIAAPAIADVRTFPNAVARAATVAAEELDVKAIVVFTNSGSTARMLTTHRPNREIIACTPNHDVLRRLALDWGVTPLHINRMDNTDDLIAAVERQLRAEGRATPGDELLITMGIPIGEASETNLIKFHRVSDDEHTTLPQSRW